MSLVLVTGGAGSAGKLVVKELSEIGHSVRVFDLPGMDYSDLEGKEGIEILRGNITQSASVQQAVAGVSAVVHLAALLPPSSERNRELTFAVNVEGTARLAAALKQANPVAVLVFTSSVSTYGDTTNEKRSVTVAHSQQALDIYAESKIAAEKSLHDIYPGTVILRISGISVPSIQSPPEVWPFMADQRIEFVHREDVVTAICNSVTMGNARGHVFNIAGGASWRTTGKEYVKDYFNLLGVPIEEAQFQDKPGWCDWYDTGESQRVLHYQNNSYQAYLQQLKNEIQQMMSE
jgi:nucleoside-diphosphate-sugar epimerase